MFEMFRLLLSASPVQIVLAVMTAVLFLLVVVLAPVLKIDAKAWVLRKRGVTKKKVAAWTLAEVKKERPNPLVEIINTIRNKRNDESP